MTFVRWRQALTLKAHIGDTTSAALHLLGGGASSFRACVNVDTAIKRYQGHPIIELSGRWCSFVGTSSVEDNAQFPQAKAPGSSGAFVVLVPSEGVAIIVVCVGST